MDSITEIVNNTIPNDVTMVEVVHIFNALCDECLKHISKSEDNKHIVAALSTFKLLENTLPNSIIEIFGGFLHNNYDLLYDNYLTLPKKDKLDHDMLYELIKDFIEDKKEVICHFDKTYSLLSDNDILVYRDVLHRMLQLYELYQHL